MPTKRTKNERNERKKICFKSWWCFHCCNRVCVKKLQTRCCVRFQIAPLLDYSFINYAFSEVRNAITHRLAACDAFVVQIYFRLDKRKEIEWKIRINSSSEEATMPSVYYKRKNLKIIWKREQHETLFKNFPLLKGSRADSNNKMMLIKHDFNKLFHQRIDISPALDSSPD